MFVHHHAQNYEAVLSTANRTVTSARRRAEPGRAPLRRVFAVGAAVLTACLALSLSPAIAVAAAAPATATAQSVSSTHHAVAAVAPLVRATQTSTLASIDRDLLAYVNKARAAHKLTPLVEQRSIVRLANVWSTHLAGGPSKSTFGHNPNLRSMVLSRMPAVRTYGENVASFTTGSYSAYAILKAYLASPSHRANILNPAYRYVGIVTHTGPDGMSYNTMNFAG